MHSSICACVEASRGTSDIIIILRPSYVLIKTALEHSPKAHIGVLNPGEISWADQLNENNNILLNNVDFFVVIGFMWRDLLLRYNKRVYQVIDYEYAENKNIFRKKYGLENKFIFLFAGIMGPAQNLDFIIQIAEMITDLPEVYFLFLGEGSAKKRLQKI